VPSLREWDRDPLTDASVFKNCASKSNIKQNERQKIDPKLKPLEELFLSSSVYMSV